MIFKEFHFFPIKLRKPLIQAREIFSIPFYKWEIKRFVQNFSSNPEMTSVLLCFQSPVWSTQLPVIFTLCGFVLGHFLPPNFRLPIKWNSENLFLTENVLCSSRHFLHGEICQVEVWVGKWAEYKNTMWNRGSFEIRACPSCVQGNQVGFFWKKDLEAWEGLGLVSCSAGWGARSSVPSCSLLLL